MSRKKPNLVFVLWDVGRGSKDVLPDGEMVLEKQKRCINKIIFNKVLFEPKDQVGLLKFATEETDHPASEDDFPNMHYQCDFEFDKLKMMDVVDSTTSTDLQQEFLGALCVALTILKKEMDQHPDTKSKKAKAQPVKAFESVKIILVTNLEGICSKDETRSLTKPLKQVKGINCSLFVIGHDIGLRVEELEREENLEYFQDCPDEFDSQTALRLLFKYNSGIYWTFDEAMMNLNSFTSKKVVPRNSKVLLELGTHLKIKVQYYNEVCEESRLDFKVCNTADIAKKTGYDRVYTTKGGKRKMVEEEEVIKGFKFGTSIIPFSEEDKSAMEYKSGLPCLKILGFCKQKTISPIMYVGATTVNIFPVQEDKASVVAFKALVNEMHQLGRVAIARRVVMNNGKLTLAALTPRIVPGDERLISVELPFAEDVIDYKFPRTKQKSSEEQLEVLRELVDKMDLMQAGPDESELFQPRSIPNPVKIYTNGLVIHRARHADKPVEPPSKLIVSLLETSESILQAAEDMDAQLAQVFKVADVRKSLAKVRVPRPSVPTAPRDQILDEDSQGDLDAVVPIAPQAKPVRIVQVGSITPAEDFHALIQQGVPLDEVCRQCQIIVLQLAVRSQHDLHKPLTAIRVMRQTCVKDNPALYNDWLAEFRNELSERGQLGLWLKIMDDNLGPITTEENPEAKMSRVEANKFLSEPPPDKESQKMDIDSLLDDM
ncbi:X-ray repair cross-complementing protein 5-like [Neocloeon triangulifer]|uniref:X-ray repair cross-complementing protein 5-like n=1 Tax=Neocloeon triangulifer TaxID=2078957 RepID=UPI00286F55A2|nr:X-ray repair cross-complementing protein 5-like [Neocloeon triangulifer]